MESLLSVTSRFCLSFGLLLTTLSTYCQISGSGNIVFDFSNQFNTESFEIGFNAAKLLEEYNFSTDSSGDCYIAPGLKAAVVTALTDMAPAVIRFPGGGDQSQFIHFNENTTGYGFDLSDWGEVYLYMLKKDRIEWRRRAIDQNDLPDKCSYLNAFIELINDVPDAKVIYTANVFTSTPKEQFWAVQQLIENGVDVVGIELGNEMYGFTVWDSASNKIDHWYNDSDGGRAAGNYVRDMLRPHLFTDTVFFDSLVCDSSMLPLIICDTVQIPELHSYSMSFVSMADSLSALYGFEIPIGITAAPPEKGNENLADSVTLKRLVQWNDTLRLYRNEEWIDAFIVHMYARQLAPPCKIEIGEVAGDSVFIDADKTALFNCFVEAVRDYFAPDTGHLDESDHFRRHFVDMSGNFRSLTDPPNELWITEWAYASGGRNDASLISNTFLDALFTQRWLHEAINANVGYAKLNHGLRIRYMNRQLLTGAVEGAMIGEFTQLDKNYKRNSTFDDNAIWGIDGPRFPKELRRTAYWPHWMYNQHELSKTIIGKTEGIDEAGPLNIYAYLEDNFLTGDNDLLLYFTYSGGSSKILNFDNFNYRGKLAWDTCALGEAITDTVELSYISGKKQWSSAGYNRLSDISGAKNPPAVIPPFHYAHPITSTFGNIVEIPQNSVGFLRIPIGSGCPVVPPVRVGAEFSVLVTPNPTDQYLYIKADHEIEKIEIFEMTGRKVIEQLDPGNDFQLDVSFLAAGNYLIYSTCNGLSTPQLIVIK
nr:hypothetical protein [uncultured bacterium]